MISNQRDGADDGLRPNSLVPAFAWMAPARPHLADTLKDARIPCESPQAAADYFKGMCLPRPVCSACGGWKRTP